MLKNHNHTPAGAAVVDLVDEAFRLRGRLLALGKLQAAGTQLSGLSQQIILTAIVRAKEPPTVARIARSLGYTRQAVQRIANDLEQDGHVRYENNPYHARAKQLVPTEQGIAAYTRSNDANVEWVDSAGKLLGGAEVAKAAAVLRGIRQYLEREWLVDVHHGEEPGAAQAPKRSGRKSAGQAGTE